MTTTGYPPYYRRQTVLLTGATSNSRVNDFLFFGTMTVLRLLL
jgi:hypothetical protein